MRARSDSGVGDRVPVPVEVGPHRAVAFLVLSGTRLELLEGQTRCALGVDLLQPGEKLFLGVDDPPVPGNRDVVVGGWRGVLDSFGQLLEGKNRLRTVIVVGVAHLAHAFQSTTDPEKLA